MGDVVGKSAPALDATSDMPAAQEAPAISEEVNTPAPETPKQDKAPATPEPEAEAEPDASGDEGDAKPAKEAKDGTPPWMKAEITKERNRRRAAETRATQLEDDLRKALTLGASAKQAEQTQTALDTTDPRPKREAFDNPDAYDTALEDWSGRRATRLANETINKANESQRIAEQQRQQNEANQVVLKSWEEKRAKAAETHPDYDEVTGADTLNITTQMAATILQADNGTDVAYHLGKNPAEADRIAALPPVKQIYEIGRLSATLGAKQPATTKAPAPIKPLGSNARATAKSPDDESMEEYASRRSAELAQQRRGFNGQQQGRTH